MIIQKIAFATLLVGLPIVSMANPIPNDTIFQDFQKLQSDINRIFENFHKQFFSDIPSVPTIDSGFSFSIKTDIIDKGDHYEVKANLPGVDKGAISVKVKDNILEIEAKSEKSQEDKKADKIIRQERFVGSLYRAITLPKDIDTDKMKTKYKDGVLIVFLPKSKS